jgi:hypothetical protein
MSGTFSNIKSDGQVRLFQTYGDISGKFSNIEVGNTDYSTFYSSTGKALGEFSDVTFGINGGFFDLSGGIIAKIKNIISSTANGDCFISLNNQIQGTFSNIKVQDVTGNFFYSAATFSGTFENIEVGDISQNLFSSLGNVNLSIDKLKSGSVASSIFSGVDLKANIKNVDIKDYSGNGFYYTGTSNVYCIIDNLTIGNCNAGVLFRFDGDLYGTFSNFNTNNSGTTFEINQAVRSLNMKNMDLGTCSQLLPNGTSATGNKVLIDNLNVKPSFAISDFDGTIRNSRIEMLAPNRPAIVLIGGDLSIIERCVLLSTGTWSISSADFDGSTPFISFTRASGGIQPTITNKIGSALEAKNILE